MTKAAAVAAAALASLAAVSATAAASAAPLSFLSGAAANAVLAGYRSALEVQSSSHASSSGSFGVTIVEDYAQYTVDVYRSSEQGTRTLLSHVRADRSASEDVRANDAVLFGTKTLDGVRLDALVAALDAVRQHPAADPSIRDATSAGHWIVGVSEPGTEFVFVEFGYPGGAELGRSSIGCNPRRAFRYDISSQTLTEIKPSCP